MRLARVRLSDNSIWLGRVTAEAVVLLTRESLHPAADGLREALAANIDFAGAGPSVPLADVQLLAPVIRPSKILGIGLNYADHVLEAGADLPTSPLIFAKAPSSIVGPGEPIRFSTSQSTQVDYEAELAVVIGTCASGRLSEPFSHVLGYTVCDDVSARDAQFGDGQWVRGKSFDTFCPLGPWITTPDEISDVQALRIGTTIDGERLQDGTTADMIFTVAELISYLARYLTLEPGDVIATGTPYGVGMARQPPRFLSHGEQVTCWVEGLGELTNPVEVL